MGDHRLFKASFTIATITLIPVSGLVLQGSADTKEVSESDRNSERGKDDDVIHTNVMGMTPMNERQSGAYQLTVNSVIDVTAVTIDKARLTSFVFFCSLLVCCSCLHLLCLQFLNAIPMWFVF